MTDVTDWDTVHILDAWRFVRHADRLLTTGFAQKEALLRNADIIRSDVVARKSMQKRYAEAYP